MSQLSRYSLYTDGACSKNGNGGWAWVLVQDGDLRTYDHGELRDTTNQRAELVAAIMGFQYLETQLATTGRPRGVTLISDSAYLINCLNDRWYDKWYDNGFLNSAGEPVANQDLWIDLLVLLEDRWIKEIPTEYVHIRGHGKDASVSQERQRWNAMCDDLAVQAKGWIDAVKAEADADREAG